MTNVIRAPFPWFGGKAGHKIKDAILSALPPHKRYLEPFGGGASILISKQSAEVEVYNDVNRGVVNFFRVISDVDYFGKFMARAALLPVSRELYEEYSRTWTGIHDPLEQAVRWYYIARQSFGGMFGSSWGTAVNSSCAGMSSRTSQWISSFDNLPRVHERISASRSSVATGATSSSGSAATAGWHTAIRRMSQARARPGATNTSSTTAITRN